MSLTHPSAGPASVAPLRRPAALLLALAMVFGVLGIVSATPAAAAPADGVLRVLLFYKDNFHASHVQARQAVNELSRELAVTSGQTLEIEETQNPAVFTDANLATKDALVFAQTGGVLFNAEQRAALEKYIRSGGGYAGLHYAGWSVGQSEHDVNPFYNRLVGANSEGHPEGPAQRPGRIFVKDTTHPLAQGLPAELTRTDEWYDWTVNPAPNVRTIVEADESTYATDATGGRQGTTHPTTWCQQIDAGRSWYTGMGHETTHYSEPFIRTQLKNGIAYAAGLLPADCSPPVKERVGSWSGVTPWPLMPINMALTSDGRVQSFGSVMTGCTDANPYDWTGDNCVFQGGQFEVDIWNPDTPRTVQNVRSGIVPNTTYTDLFCAMQVQDPHGNHSTMTVGGDDGLGENAPNDAAPGVTSYSTNNGLQTEAPMNYPRWYPTGTTMPNGDIVVQGGSSRGGPGGPGVLTPEIRTTGEGSGWKTLTGATSAAAYGDGVEGPDENRWWYPRAFVTPGSGTLFNITGTMMYELDPYANGGNGVVNLRGRVPAAVASQGANGNPVGATSTAVMYQPGKILQVGGGWWANGGGPDGARGGFTVDITGGTAAPVVAPTAPMKYQRHWATSTIMPDGKVLVTGGGRENNGRDDVVTNPEIWDPATGTWTTVEVPHEHARLYHSTALLLPDGRVMIGGGGAPGPRNYTDVEYYSPSYLFDGNSPAVRPEITSAPDTIGYAGTFDVATSSDVSRVTLVRNGSITHGFNNDQNFQDLTFTETASGITIDAPKDATYAPPGAYMLFIHDADGTPSVATIVKVDPTQAMDVRTPQVVDQFDYPRIPTQWRSANPPTTIDVAAGDGRMAPWSVTNQVQLVRAAGPGQGGQGLVGYHLALGNAGSLQRQITGLDAGREYRISLRYARDNRSAGTGNASALVDVGSLDNVPLTATAANPSTAPFTTYSGTFTAGARSETLTLAAAPGSAAGMVVDDLVIVSATPGTGEVPVRYQFEEGEGTRAANTGTSSVGPATLTGATAWTPADGGIFGRGIDIPGGSNANTVDLPDNLLLGEADFTTSFWVRPETKGNWINLFHIGDGFGGGDDASFFQIQMQTQAAGNTGLAATFKAKGSGLQERVYATPTQDVAAGEWSHVAFTRTGSTGTLYLNGKAIATRNDLTIDMTDVGPTTNNWLGRNGFPDPAFDGLMDEVRLYTSSLSATDVAGLYTDGSALRTTTEISVDPASPAAFGTPVTVSAVVTPASGTAPAAGTAQLVVDGTNRGAPVALDAQGRATFPAMTDLAPGERQLQVRYDGAEGFRSSSDSTPYTIERPSGIPVRYAFDEGAGTTAANTGTDRTTGPATLTGTTGWTPEDGGVSGTGVVLPGGSQANVVDLPDNLLQGAQDFTVSMWASPDQVLGNWTALFQVGNGLGNAGSYFQIQSRTINGTQGLGATIKDDGAGTPEQRVLAGSVQEDLIPGQYNHVAFTRQGTVGVLYLNGVEVGRADNLTISLADLGPTSNNWLGRNGYPDQPFKGRMDEFRAYRSALTAGDIAGLYAAGEALVHYTFDETTGRSAANTGADQRIGPGTLVGGTAFTPQGQLAGAIELPGTDADYVDLPDNLSNGLTDGFSVSMWARPDQLRNWSPLFQIGTGQESFFQIQSQTQAGGQSRLAATFKAAGSPVQERLVLGLDNDPEPDDLTVGRYNHVVFTMQGGTGRFYLDGQLVGERTDFNLGIADVGVNGTTVDNFVGNNGYPDPHFDGRFDDLRIYGFQLSAEEVRELSQPAGPPNTAPVGKADAYTTESGKALTVPAPGVLANDTDAENNTLTATDVTQPASGTVTLDPNGSFTYTPAAGFTGSTFFTYTANDGRAKSAPTRVDLTVTAPANSAPTGRPDTYTTDQDTALRVPAPGVLANDTDAENNTLTATDVTQPINGTVTLAADGSFTYVPDAGFSGRDLFTYTANDGTAKSAATRVDLTVNRAQPPAVTETYASAPAFTYGKAGAVAVTVEPSTATGAVAVRNGSTVIGTGTLSGGATTVTLPAKSLAPGTYVLDVRYVGDKNHAPSSTFVQVTVDKVTPTMTVSQPVQERGGRMTVQVALTAPDGVPVTGSVEVRIQGGGTATGTLLPDGTVVVALPKGTRTRGTMTVIYGGSDLATSVRQTLDYRVR